MEAPPSLALASVPHVASRVEPKLSGLPEGAPATEAASQGVQLVCLQNRTQHTCTCNTN